MWHNTERHPNISRNGTIETRGRKKKSEEEVVPGVTPPSMFGSQPYPTQRKGKPKPALVVYTAAATRHGCSRAGIAMFVNHGHPGNRISSTPSNDEGKASIMAVLRAIDWVPVDVDLEIRTSSSLVNAGIQRLDCWERSGWVDTPQQNLGLWKQLAERRRSRSATTRVVFVEGSSTNPDPSAAEAWLLALEGVDHTPSPIHPRFNASSTTPSLTPNSLSTVPPGSPEPPPPQPPPPPPLTTHTPTTVPNGGTGERAEGGNRSDRGEGDIVSQVTNKPPVEPLPAQASAPRMKTKPKPKGRAGAVLSASEDRGEVHPPTTPTTQTKRPHPKTATPKETKRSCSAPRSPPSRVIDGVFTHSDEDASTSHSEVEPTPLF
jgi:hypothetical protein